MYKHYETSDDVFVDREEYIEWMDDALVRCKEKSVVLHLKGIGGIGKSSLLKHWIRTKERTVRVDCEHYTEFYNRLNVLAKAAVLQGVNLQRFDVLWQIRQRFVEGVEPVKEEGREWAKDVVMAIPFIGSLASIGTALSAVGTKVTPKLKGRYGTVGKWLQERLGKDHIERLLEILWKEPRHAEFLYIDALLEDINSRKDINTPILFLLDHFEYVDSENAQWKYQGKKITQTELWSIFLSSLTNCVGVMAGRKPAVKREDLELEETELTELDRESCIEMLELQGVTDKELQDRIVSVSAGNPFVVDAICDMKDEGTIALDDIECLRADTLEEVRLKTWRRLFNMAGDLQDIINRAGLLPFFNRDLLSIVAPSLTTDMWDRLLRLSFVRDRDDGTWVFHDLVYELIIAELGSRLKSLTDEVSKLLEKSAEENNEKKLLGHALTVTAFYSEDAAISKAKEVISKHIRREETREAFEILETLRLKTKKGRAEQQGLLGWALEVESRYGEAEALLKDVIIILEDLVDRDFTNVGESLAFFLSELGNVMVWTRFSEGEDYFVRAMDIQRQLVEENPSQHSDQLAEILGLYGFLLANYLGRVEEAQKRAQESVDIFRKTENLERLPWALNILGTTQTDLIKRATSYQEAFDLQEKFAAQEPDNLKHKSMLAAIGHNFTWSLYFEGRIPEAEDMHKLVIRLREELAEINPQSFEWRVAWAWAIYGEFLWHTRQFTEAKEVNAKSLQMLEKFYEEDPDAARAALADSLMYLGRCRIVSGEYPEARSLIDRGIAITRNHLEQIKESYQTRNTMASQLSRISTEHHRKTLQKEQAENELKEAISIHREYKDRNPANRYLLGQTLSNMGAFHLCMGEDEKAEVALGEATAILREDREVMLLRSRVSYAESLCNYAIVKRREGNLDKASSIYQDALNLFQEIAKMNPIKGQYDYTLTLNNYALLLMEKGSHNDAMSNLQESLCIQKQWAEKEPELFDPILAISFNNQGILFAQIGKLTEAIHSFNEAIRIRRNLVKDMLDTNTVGLAISLHNLGIGLIKNNRSPDAEKSIGEAIELWKQLVVKIPEVFQPRLAKSLRLESLESESLDDSELWIVEEEPLHSW